MNAVYACGEDEFRGYDAHSLAFEVVRDTLDDGRLVEEALLADTDIGREAGLGLLLRAQRRNIAGRCLRETSDASGKVEELGCGKGTDEGGEIGCEDVHTGLDVGC